MRSRYACATSPCLLPAAARHARDTMRARDPLGQGGGFGQIRWVDIVVFLLFLVVQLLWRVGVASTVACVLQALPFCQCPSTSPHRPHANASLQSPSFQSS